MSLKLTDEQAELYNKLTRLQKYTAAAYLQGYNQARAYTFACESLNLKVSKNPEVSGCEILKNANVVEFITSVRKPIEEELIEDSIMTFNELAQLYTRFARGNLDDLVEFGHMDPDDDTSPQRWWWKDSKNLTREKLSLVRELSSSKEGLKIKIHDPMTAGKHLGEMLGFNPAKQLDLTSSDGSMSPRPFNDFYNAEEETKNSDA